MVDPTIIADGVAIWEHGRLYPERVPGGQAILERHGDIAQIFANPTRQIGL